MAESELLWRVEQRDGTAIVAPSGRVDETTASAFSERLVGEVDAGASAGVTRLVVDLNGIAYMSSRGLRALTIAQRKAQEAGTTIVLAQPNAIMREILAISRYDLVFKVFERVDDALAA